MSVSNPWFGYNLAADFFFFNEMPWPLWGFCFVFCFGHSLIFEEASDSSNTDEGGEEEDDEDEDYVPEWQEEYDDEDLDDDDNLSYDDESENLERDSFFFEDEAY